MEDEPTIGEQFRRLGDQLSRVEARVAELVSSERFEFSRREIDTRISAQDARIDKLERENEKQRDHEVQTRRLVWTVFLVPLGLILLQFYLSSWGK